MGGGKKPPVMSAVFSPSSLRNRNIATAEHRPPPPNAQLPDHSTCSSGAPLVDDGNRDADNTGESPEQQEAVPTKDERPMLYSCRKCRSPLFSTGDVIPHDESQSAKGHKGFLNKPFLQRHATSSCSSLFLDLSSVEWLETQVHSGVDKGGDLVCPGARCGAKIGSWSWIGAQCSCGQWVNPAFKVLESRMDAVPINMA